MRKTSRRMCTDNGDVSGSQETGREGICGRLWCERVLFFCSVISHPNLGGGYFPLLLCQEPAWGSAALLCNVSPSHLPTLLCSVHGRKVQVHGGHRPGISVSLSLCVHVGFLMSCYSQGV